VAEIASLSEEFTVTKETLEQQISLTEDLKSEKVSLEVKAAEAEEQIEGLLI